MNKYSKYTWVCTGDCDALIEYTFKDGFGWSNGVMQLTCPCGSNCTLLSVANATIVPSTTKEETDMDTLTPAPQTMTLDWIENDVTTTQTYTESDIRSMHWSNKNLNAKQNEYYRKESQLRTLLEEVYADSSDQDTLTQIAEIFDVSLTKEIEVTAYIRVDMVIEVDMAEGDYDIEDMVRNNLTVDSFGSEISVNDYDIERVEEGAY
jgi:hypothetical protein